VRSNWIVTPDKFLAPDQVARLRASADLQRRTGEVLSVRNAAVIEVLLGTGLRVSEVCSLKVGELYLQDGRADVVVRRGKGNKSRMVAVSARLAAYLREFLAWRATCGQRTDPERPLFVSERGGPLTRSAVHRVWKAALAKSKINLVGTVDTLSTDKDFSGAATTTVADKPDLVILDMQANAAPLLARALGQEGYKGHMVGTYGMTLPALYPVAGSAFDNMTMAAEYIYLFNNPTNKKFVADYEARFGAVPDFFSASAFSSLLFLAQAIKNSGLSTDRSKLAAAMNKIKTFNCPLGNLTMLGGNAYFSGKATFVAFAPGGALHIVWQQPTKKK